MLIQIYLMKWKDMSNLSNIYSKENNVMISLCNDLFHIEENFLYKRRVTPYAVA